MKDERFLVVVAHPRWGRILRLRVQPSLLHLVIGFAAVAMVATFGFGIDYVRAKNEAGRLLSENAVLQGAYHSAAATVGERDQQLDSLAGVAYEVSIAYGIRRDERDLDSLDNLDMEPAYYASLSQYGHLRTALDGRSGGFWESETLPNSKPSIWPVKGYISSSYGRRVDPFHGKGAFHPGMDISAPRYTPVVATADGYVSFVGWDSGRGRTIRIVHGNDGYTTLYGHLNDYLVRRGQMVRRGEVIGLVGSSGRTTGNHVHYEIHLRGISVNPYRYLRNRERTYEFSLAD